jgi:hypothetical protein
MTAFVVRQTKPTKLMFAFSGKTKQKRKAKPNIETKRLPARHVVAEQ